MQSFAGQRPQHNAFLKSHVSGPLCSRVRVQRPKQNVLVIVTCWDLTMY